ncbi:MAG: hypothetical protein EBU84_09805 [Actinobacteria bacterium]|nr:hypothetical protein [Actinomycetota bacterium]
MLKQNLALVVSQGLFHNDPRHQLWATTLRTIGWQVIEAEIIDQPNAFRQLISAMTHGDLISVRVDRTAAAVDLTIPASSSTGRFLRSSDAVVRRGANVLRAMGVEPNLVIANDLLAGRAAILEWPKSTIVYDAHESFVASFDMLPTQPLQIAERSYWTNAEREVMLCSTLNVTVSPGLSTFQKSETGVGSLVVPNYFSKKNLAKVQTRDLRPVRFVFIGRHDRHRGIEKLVEAWNVNPTFATLDVYVPGRQSRRLLERLTGRGHGFTKFYDAVHPSQIIETVSRYDVGVIPYDYPYPYSEASPNKFGEYLAAGVALLVNRQGFTAPIINKYGLGEIFEWDKEGSIHSAIQRLCDLDHLAEVRRNVQHAFELELNWDIAVQSVILELERVCPSRESSDALSSTNILTYSERFGLPFALWSWIVRLGLRMVRRSGTMRTLVSQAFSWITLLCESFGGEKSFRRKGK